MKTVEVQYKGKTVKVNEGYPPWDFSCLIHDLEETILHTAVKNLVAVKLNYMTPQELCDSETWEDADKKFPIREHLSGRPAKNLIYNHLPRQDFNQKVRRERPLSLNGFPMKPDVCILNADFKPHSIFEIIVTSKPDIKKLIAMIEAPVNVVFVYAEDVIIELSRYFNQHKLNWSRLFKCFTGWSATDSLTTKVSRAIDMLIADKFPAKQHDILEKKIKKNGDLYKLFIKTDRRDWHLHPGSKAGKPTSTLNALLKYYAEKIDASTEEVHYDDNTMIVEFVVGRTLPKKEWSNDPFHIGTILKASRGETIFFTNRETAIINKTNYQNVSDGERVHFVCGINNYGTNGYNKYYANHLANEKKNLNKTWMLE